MYLISLIKNQYVAAFSGAMTLMICGSCFVWCTPLLPKLQGPDAILQMTPTEISWMVSIIEFGSLISPIPSGMIADRWGRKVAMLTAAPSAIASWLIILYFKDVYAFYATRILQGHAVGVVFTVCPMYLGEIATAKARGGLTTLVQTMWYVGFLWQYCTGSFLSYEMNAALNLFVALFFFVVFMTQPESPYFLMMKDREERADKMLRSLRCGASDEAITKEIVQIKESLELEKSNVASWSDLVATSADRQILLITQVLTAVRLSSGTVSISSYLSELLVKVDWHELQPESCMVIFSSVTIATILVATFTVDWVGRLPLLIVSQIGTIVSNLAVATFFWLQDYSDLDLASLKWFPAAALVSFTFFFSLGLGPVSQTIQSELFPSHTRGYGSVISVFNMTFTSFISLRSFQILTDAFGIYANFLCFAVICAMGLVFTCLYVPETKGKTFYEIRSYFVDKQKSKEDIEQNVKTQTIKLND